MTFNQIRKLALNYKGETIEHIDNDKINYNIISIIDNCLKKNISLNFTEDDYIKIVNIYYDLYGVVYDDFLKAVLENSGNNISLYNVIDKITN